MSVTENTRQHSEKESCRTQSSAISVGVITIQGRESALEKLLKYLTLSVSHYTGNCELVICNNSEAGYLDQINEIVQATNIRNFCAVRIIQSTENNIAVARNILLKESTNRLLAFIDDDEYPSEQWLTELAFAIDSSDTHVVAGPVIAKYPVDTPVWIVNSDPHNAENRKTGSILEFAPTCNLLIDKQCIPQPVFDVDYGKSGGSDTEFFLRNVRVGVIIRWAAEALVYEDVDASRANTKFMIRRYMAQGQVFRRIKTLHNDVPNQFVYSINAWLAAIVSIAVAALLFVVYRQAYGPWLKRGFFNLGKVVKAGRLLYE